MVRMPRCARNEAYARPCRRARIAYAITGCASRFPDKLCTHTRTGPKTRRRCRARVRGPKTVMPASHWRRGKGATTQPQFFSPWCARTTVSIDLSVCSHARARANSQCSPRNPRGFRASQRCGLMFRCNKVSKFVYVTDIARAISVTLCCIRADVHQRYPVPWWS